MYTVEHFNNAEIIEIDEKILEIFCKLNRQFNKKNLHNKKPLKKTNIAIDHLSCIKTIINKTTVETYDENCDDLIKKYNDFIDKTECCGKIFDILSKNSFYSSLYASLYSQLIVNDTLFLNFLNDNKFLLRDQYDKIVFYDSNENYDKFCENNKINENIKAVTSFYSYLLLNGVLSEDYIIQNIIFLIEKIKNTKDNVIIFELLENINIYITITHNVIKQNKQWVNIISNINNMKRKKVNFFHLKNKCVFKCMDILDFVEKNIEHPCIYHPEATASNVVTMR